VAKDDGYELTEGANIRSGWSTKIQYQFRYQIIGDNPRQNWRSGLKGARARRFEVVKSWIASRAAAALAKAATLPPQGLQLLTNAINLFHNEILYRFSS
jgi:hypothetical protein